MIHFNFPYLRIKKMNSRSKAMLSVFVIQLSLVLHFTNIHLAPKMMYRRKKLGVKLNFVTYYFALSMFR